MQSSNPVLTRADSFNGRTNQNHAGPFSQQAGYGQAPYAQAPYGQAPYGQAPYDQAPYGQAPYSQAPYQPSTTERRMTLDDVVAKTGIVMLVMMATAAITWMMLPAQLMFPALIVSSLVGFVVVMFASMRRLVSPPLVLAYAVLEGVFIGVFSKLFENYYPGIVAQAVLGTFAAAGVTLFAYKFFNIRVTERFRKVVVLSTIGLAVALLLNFVLSLAGVDMGLRGGVVGAPSLLVVAVSAIAVVLAVLNLVLDFDFIERGIASGAPASESWRAALGLVVTMVWLYTELLRILSYFRD